MHRLLTFKRLSVIFLTAFAACFALILAYEHFVRAPGERCEEQGKWWDPEGRVCAQPISVAEKIAELEALGLNREQASAQRNRELVAIEDQLAANEKAVAADADRQRAALKAEQAR
ncbi:MAG TPA: hypothetical protein VGR32_03145 [Brevundimonas sp.]|jgi:hypothetical protein|uniref:hypothetical protein n=1 Tax=Brevundimonas sp. TaxID=1871086 RepID=UPI002DEF396A|nr:hypothetical protein [Brevundimonas sp.]